MAIIFASVKKIYQINLHPLVGDWWKAARRNPSAKEFNNSLPFLPGIIAIWALLLPAVCMAANGKCNETRGISSSVEIAKIDRISDNSIDVTLRVATALPSAKEIPPTNAYIALLPRPDFPVDFLVDDNGVCAGCEIIDVPLTAISRTPTGQKARIALRGKERVTIASAGYACSRETKSGFRFFSALGYDPIEGKSMTSSRAYKVTIDEQGLDKQYVALEIFIPASMYESVGVDNWVVSTDKTKDPPTSSFFLSGNMDGLPIPKTTPPRLKNGACSYPCNWSAIYGSLKIGDFSAMTVPGGAFIYWIWPVSSADYNLSINPHGGSPIRPVGRVIHSDALEEFISQLKVKIKEENSELFLEESELNVYSIFTALREATSGSNFVEWGDHLEAKSLAGMSKDEVSEQIRESSGLYKPTPLTRDLATDGIELFSDSWSRVNAPWKSSKGTIGLEVDLEQGLMVGLIGADGKINKVCSKDENPCVLTPDQLTIAAKNGLFFRFSDYQDGISGAVARITARSSKIKRAYSIKFYSSAKALVRRELGSLSNKFVVDIRKKFPGNVLSGESFQLEMNSSTESVSFSTVSSDGTNLEVGVANNTKINVATKAGNNFLERMEIISRHGENVQPSYYSDFLVNGNTRKKLAVLGFGGANDMAITLSENAAKAYVNSTYSSGGSVDYISLPWDYGVGTRIPRKMDIRGDGITVDGFGLTPWEFTGLIKDGEYDEVVYFGHGLLATPDAAGEYSGAPMVGAYKNGDHFEKFFLGYQYPVKVPNQGTDRLFLSFACQPSLLHPNDKSKLFNYNQVIAKDWKWRAAGSDKYMSSMFKRMYSLTEPGKVVTTSGYLASVVYAKSDYSSIDWEISARKSTKGNCEIPVELQPFEAKYFEFNPLTLLNSPVPFPRPDWVGFNCEVED